jgi:nucleotide-binding universal stress UspA family protein
MFDHLLVPVRMGQLDGGPLEAALGLAKLSQARVTLVHVVEKVPGMPASDVRAFYEQLSEKAERELARTAKAFSREGIPVESTVVVGDDAAVEVVRLATKRRVDLIVMGSHTVRAEEQGRGFGTTSYKVGLMCQCPVFLIKEVPETKPARRPSTRTVRRTTRSKK